MKKLIPLLSLGLFATILPSCCGFGGCKRPGRIERATAQNGTGEAHIGTIPTMKVLAE